MALDAPMTIRDALTLVELVRATRPRHPYTAIEDALLDLDGTDLGLADALGMLTLAQHTLVESYADRE